MELNIKHTKVFTQNYEALLNPDIRFVINQGSSRSSKSYSIAQLLIWYCLSNKNKKISVIRKTLPALKASALQDFIQILQELELTDQVNYNKSDSSFVFRSGCIINFFSADNSQKLRGRKHDMVFLNEANELTKEDFEQIAMRCNDTLFLDFNPSDQFSYIYEILKDNRAIKIHSTYKDNPYLPESIVRQIEGYRITDPERWQVYGLGLNIIRKERIFPKIQYSEFPEDLDFVYGMDFGWVDPTTLVKVGVRDGRMYMKEIFYESNYTTPMTIERFAKLEISKTNRIYADSAEPSIIRQLQDEGYYISKSNKKITEGLDWMRSHEMHIDPSSINMSKEFENYSYKKVHDMITEKPIDFYNHTIDAARYAAMSYKRGFSTTFGFA